VKRRPLERTLQALRRVREAPEAEESRRELREVLGGEGSHAVARAATLVGELGLASLVPDLVAAFPRFFEDPVRTDPGCAAKTAIVEALRRLERDERAIYRRGAAHVQMEPVFGGRVDTAVDLRSASGMALAESAGPDVLVDLAHLLADREAPVRVSAARAISVHGRDGGVPLLHLKALAGDPEPRVVSECLLSLLRLGPDDALPFVASFFDRGDAAAEAAAIALGESRRAEALPLLRGFLDRASRRGLARVTLLAVASLRRDEAVDLLLSLAKDGPGPLAREALSALASVGGGEALYERAKSVVEGRPELKDALARAFGRER
jgi:HEAT repeat protein